MPVTMTVFRGGKALEIKAEIGEKEIAVGDQIQMENPALTMIPGNAAPALNAGMRGL